MQESSLLKRSRFVEKMFSSKIKVSLFAHERNRNLFINNQHNYNVLVVF